MDSFLSFVNATAEGCRIYRETSGCYVVSHERQPQKRLPVATLAGAYAACSRLERSGGPASGPSGGSGRGHALGGVASEVQG
jgi:hypothetical protein